MVANTNSHNISFLKLSIPRLSLGKLFQDLVLEKNKPSRGKASKFLWRNAGRIDPLRFLHLDRLEGVEVFPVWVGIFGRPDEPDSQRLPAFASEQISYVKDGMLGRLARIFGNMVPDNHTLDDEDFIAKVPAFDADFEPLPNRDFEMVHELHKSAGAFKTCRCYFIFHAVSPYGRTQVLKSTRTFSVPKFSLKSSSKASFKFFGSN